MRGGEDAWTRRYTVCLDQWFTNRQVQTSGRDSALYHMVGRKQYKSKEINLVDPTRHAFIRHLGTTTNLNAAAAVDLPYLFT